MGAKNPPLPWPALTTMVYPSSGRSPRPTPSTMRCRSKRAYAGSWAAVAGGGAPPAGTAAAGGARASTSASSALDRPASVALQKNLRPLYLGGGLVSGGGVAAAPSLRVPVREVRRGHHDGAVEAAQHRLEHGRRRGEAHVGRLAVRVRHAVRDRRQQRRPRQPRVAPHRQADGHRGGRRRALGGQPRAVPARDAGDAIGSQRRRPGVVLGRELRQRVERQAAHVGARLERDEVGVRGAQRVTEEAVGIRLRDERGWPEGRAWRRDGEDEEG